MFLSTKEVSQTLGISTASLKQSIFRGKIAAPQRTIGRAFLWSPREVEQASWALRHRGWEGYRPGYRPRSTLAELEAA